MRSWIHKLTDIFKIEEMQEIKTQDVLFAFEDAVARKLWFQEIFREIIRINVLVDKRLLGGNFQEIPNLAARRQALQFALEAILAAKRQAKGHNPLEAGQFDLESVTAIPV